MAKRHQQKSRSLPLPACTRVLYRHGLFDEGRYPAYSDVDASIPSHTSSGSLSVTFLMTML